VTNVVSLQEKLKAKRQGEGEVTFISCPCTAEGTPPLAVILHDAQGPLVVALVCPECEQEIGVVNGRLVANG